MNTTRTIRTQRWCLIPWFDGVILSREWKEATWDKFVTGAPRQRTRSVQPRNRDAILFRPMRFGMIFNAIGIVHRLTKPNHPWSLRDHDLIQWIKSHENGQVERMNRTNKDATVTISCSAISPTS